METARRPVFAAEFDDAPALASVLWEAAAADAAILTTGVLLGVFIGRWLR